MELERASENASAQLLAELTTNGRWEGELSSSALATAVASFALKQAGRNEMAERGFQWLKLHRNADGGWGDSPDSPSNFTTTLLCRCALGEPVGSSDQVAASILDFYGNDRTFSVPILTMCMLSGNLGSDWSILPQLPFELAALPHGFYKFLRLPVVSYALPALIAIGLVRHRNRPTRFSFVRERLVARVLEILHRIQPASGGFLEAAPLSGFVGMSLVGAGFGEHRVAEACFGFLENTVRDDGSWPIDVNLSTWVTSLSVRALEDKLSGDQKDRIREHLLETQFKQPHPFTHASPGGWSWTYESGGVPDADDTAAALIALHRLGGGRAAAETGIQWLMDLQNRDGGVPTFCRGWGRLPFDRSCPDITAHMIRAFTEWRPEVGAGLRRKMDRSIRKGLRYLAIHQRSDGSWIPLWFGSQSHPKHENPIYGTVRVLEALRELSPAGFPCVEEMMARGFRWLEQTPDRACSIEETALAAGVSGRWVDQLLDMTDKGNDFPSSPIGLYFASLWYSEKLYPLIFSVEALQRVRNERGME